MKASDLNIGIIIQARAGSNRLPNKMIIPFYNDNSILEILIKRFRNENISNIPFIIATTLNPLDDNIQKVCEKMAVKYFRGPENDVLLRFIQASEHFKFDYIIRICADNPLLDIVGTMNLLNQNNLSELDYTAYKMKDGRASILSHLGFWGEVVSLSALKHAYNSTDDSIYREHVTNFIYGNPDKFNIKLIDAPENYGSREDIRLTVDTHSDFDMIQEIYIKLIEQKISMDPKNIVNFLDTNPDYLERMKKQIEKNKK